MYLPKKALDRNAQDRSRIGPSVLEKKCNGANVMVIWFGSARFGGVYLRSQIDVHQSAQGGYPQGGYPQGGYPQGGYPPPGGYPPGGYPPQTGYPAQPGFQPGYGGAGFGEPAGYPGPGQGSLGEDGDVKGFDFNEQSIRKAFIRKPTQMWVQRNTFMFWIAFATVFICLIVMSCCGNVRRQAPMNFIFLGIFTVAESFLLGVTSSMYDGTAVMMAVGITAAICLTLTLFAMQTKYDFTAMGGILLCATVVLLLFGLIAMFLPGNRIVTLVYASLGALLFSVYLVYDTQLMMGGTHKYSISPEEYVFAALNLYLDVINIFVYILTIIGASRD
ncbi:Glutamate [NMDA] receptor-associated protein 1 [Papilio machaon]|uniref:Glutamate [NMDA] receptor-associated protein 1 n=2 Tax=Papilio TaxID=7145 RepID=A0A0N0PBA4_PAPMA|nr:Glutamate [NMDA] receptor-associated protein 1 [Papilio machaon]